MKKIATILSAVLMLEPILIMAVIVLVARVFGMQDEYVSMIGVAMALMLPCAIIGGCFTGSFLQEAKEATEK
jgi:ABC-type glycerol-3-phosphate transport system permease component